MTSPLCDHELVRDLSHTRDADGLVGGGLLGAGGHTARASLHHAFNIVHVVEGVV